MARVIGLARVVCLVLGVSLGGLWSGAAAAKGSADVQWAQQVLTEKGFEVGRPNGEMNQKTRAALSSFQRISGLAVTGELDPATTAKLLEGRPGPVGGGMLGVPKPNHPGAGSGAARGGALPPAPHAVPSGAVSAVASAPLPPAPHAAPSGAVSAAAVAQLSGQAPVAMNDDGDTQSGPLQIEVAGWVRTVVVGVIFGIFAGFGVLWWWSGRKTARRPGGHGRSSPGGERREPSFAPPTPQRGDRELRVRRL